MAYIMAALGGTIVGFVGVMVGAQVIHHWLTGLKVGNEKRMEKEFIRRKW